MKIIYKLLRNLVIYLVVFSFYAKLYGQDQAKPDCSQKSSAYAQSVAIQFLKPKHNFNAVLALTDAWYEVCGYSEPVIRAAILNELAVGNVPNQLMSNYFTNNLNHEYTERLKISEAKMILVNLAQERANLPNELFFMDDNPYLSYAADSNFYSLNQSFFGYVPYNSKFDTACQIKAMQLLDSTWLSDDGRLMCRFISDSPGIFRHTLSNSVYRKTELYKTIRTTENKAADALRRVNIMAGIWRPYGKNNKTFGTNPYLGIGFGTVSQSANIDFAFKFKILANDDVFDYKMENVSYEVNSRFAMSGEVNLGIPLYKNLNSQLNFIIGAGLESMDTGLTIRGKTEEDPDEYHNMETMFIQLGFSNEKRLPEQQKIGIATYLMLAPYNFSSSLVTKFSSTAICVELFVKI